MLSVMPSAHGIYVGTAGWSIPRPAQLNFPLEGTHLQRYARVLPCVEINSSFYRPHMASTYARWASSVGDAFRFALKIPRIITHEQKLRRSRPALDQFLSETSALGNSRGPLLVQLPPSFAFDQRSASAFFKMFRGRHDGPVVCEPRHPTWFSEPADTLLRRHRIGRVAADPKIVDASSVPGGWKGLSYFRMHGSPRMYWSRYDSAQIERLALQLNRLAQSRQVWCIFDNTAAGAAIENALELREKLL